MLVSKQKFEPCQLINLLKAEEGEKDLGRKRVGSNEDDSVYSDWVGPVDDDRSSIASSNGGSKSKRRSKKNSRKQPKKRKTKSKK